MSSVPRLRLAFPRHKPQFFAESSVSLAAASRYYGYGRQRSKFSRRAVEILVRIPVLRRLVVKTDEFEFPHTADTWKSLWMALAEIVPASSIVVYQSQWRTERYAIMTLSHDHEVTAFAQIRPTRDAYPLPPQGAKSFRAPRVIADLEPDDISLRVFEPMPAAHEAMQWDSEKLKEITDEISSLTQDTVVGKRPVDSWVASHGDLTPWNLRIAPDGEVWLIDWEEATWAPPLADVLRYLITFGRLEGDGDSDLMNRIRKELGTGEDVVEAASYWLGHEFYRAELDTWEEPDFSSGKEADIERSTVEVRVLRRLASHT